MTARVCVVGSVNLDFAFAVAQLPDRGETVLASELNLSPGGKGGNQAVAAARAGAQVQFVGAVGTDAAAATLLDHLDANGVGIEGVVRVPGPSGTAAIVVDTGAENMIVVAPGANSHLTLDSAAVRDLVADNDVVLLQLEIPLATAIVAAKVGRNAGVVVVLNASPISTDRELLGELARVVDVVVVNETEASQWDWPVPHLVTTLGALGARYVGDTAFDVPAPAVEALDTTGAGDVFAGVLAAGWLDGLEVALARACAAGALATLVAGAGDCGPYAEAIDDAVTS